jgi:hypothetical protein
MVGSKGEPIIAGHQLREESMHEVDPASTSAASAHARRATNRAPASPTSLMAMIASGWHPSGASMSRAIRRLALLGACVLLPAAGQAQQMSWVLALPPLRDEPGPSAAHEVHDAIRDRLDTDAAVTRWQQAQVFDGGSACEDARLQALADYDAAVRSVDPDKASGDEKERLVRLAQRAFGRCVPAFAFSGRDPQG